MSFSHSQVWLFWIRNLLQVQSAVVKGLYRANHGYLDSRSGLRLLSAGTLVGKFLLEGDYQHSRSHDLLFNAGRKKISRSLLSVITDICLPMMSLLTPSWNSQSSICTSLLHSFTPSSIVMFPRIFFSKQLPSSNFVPFMAWSLKYGLWSYTDISSNPTISAYCDHEHILSLSPNFLFSKMEIVVGVELDPVLEASNIEPGSQKLWFLLYLLLWFQTFYYPR